MPVTKKTQTKYETVLTSGLIEANAAGELVPMGRDDKDEPFMIQVERVEETRVFDGRGERWADKTREREVLAKLTVPEALKLAQAILSDVEYAYEVAERRVLTAQQVSDVDA